MSKLTALAVFPLFGVETVITQHGRPDVLADHTRPFDTMGCCKTCQLAGRVNVTMVLSKEWRKVAVGAAPLG